MRRPSVRLLAADLVDVLLGEGIAHNATHMTYEHVQNVDGNVSDTWTIVQHSHGPFA